MADRAWFRTNNMKTSHNLVEVEEMSRQGTSGGNQDDSVPGCSNEDNNTHKTLAKEFLSSTTAHGLARACESVHWFRKLFWTLIFLAAFVASVSQIAILMQQYIKREVSVRIEMNSALKAHFPTVTICNTNKLRKSALAKSHNKGLLVVDTEVARPYYATECLADDFRCMNSGCIKRYLKCDGYDNCRDLSDESGCDYGDCSHIEFKCTSGSSMGVCIPNTYRCNRKLDCYDGKDEDECDCKDATVEFKCPMNGRCIAVSLLCNGKEDCPMGDDETTCTAQGIFCAEDYFKCDNNQNCIPPSAKCDGTKQCADETDEMGCPTRDPDDIELCGTDQFRCDDYTCIPIEWQCDGWTDCSNKKDEKECGAGMWDDGMMMGGGETQTANTTTSQTYTCSDGQQIPMDKFCNGHNDCNNGEDEETCPEEPKETFTCGYDGAKQEIEKKFVCNNIVDCPDAADEESCNQDQSAIYSPDPDDLLPILNQVTDDTSLLDDFIENFFYDHMFGRVVSEDPADWHGFIAYSQTPDYSDLENVLKLNEDEVKVLGHQLDDFVMSCHIDGFQCDTEHIHQFPDDKYGNCFQLNSANVDSQKRMFSTQTGAKHGLVMTLFTEQSEYTSVYGRDSGVRLLISPLGKPVSPSEEGVTIRPGMITSVGIKETVIVRKGEPFGHCSDTGAEEYYSQRHCEYTCIKRRMLEYCGCLDTISMPGDRCQLLNRTQDTCKQFINYLGTKGKLNCECPWPCKERWYETTISESLWPSNTFLKHFLKQIHYHNNKTIYINDMKKVRENFVRLNIFFEDLNYQSITEFPTMTEENLMSDIGGTLGLYCGFSFITIVEFLQFFYDLVHLSYKKYIHRKIRSH